MTTVLDQDSEAAIKSLLWKRHKGNGKLNGDDAIVLRRMKHDCGLSDEELDQMQADKVAEKAAAAAAKEAEEKPEFVDDGEIVLPAEVADMFLASGATSVQNAIQLETILNGSVPVSSLRNVRLHRLPTDSVEWFDYMLDIIRAVSDGRLKPGKEVTTVKFSGDRFADSRLNLLIADKVYIGLAAKLTGLQFIRLRGQSQAQLDEAVAALIAQAENELGNMKPTQVQTAQNWLERLKPISRTYVR